MKQAAVFVTAHFQTQQCMASCVKDLGKVRSHGWWCENVSLVSRREEELSGELAAEFIRSADALSNSRHLSLSVGAQGVTLCLSGCVILCLNICVWAGWGLTVIHYKPAGFVPSSSKFRQVLTHCSATLPFTFSHFALLTRSRIPSKYVHKDDTLLLSMERIGAI